MAKITKAIAQGVDEESGHEWVIFVFEDHPNIDLFFFDQADMEFWLDQLGLERPSNIYVPKGKT